MPMVRGFNINVKKMLANLRKLYYLEACFIGPIV